MSEVYDGPSDEQIIAAQREHITELLGQVEDLQDHRCPEVMDVDDLPDFKRPPDPRCFYWRGHGGNIHACNGVINSTHYWEVS